MPIPRNTQQLPVTLNPTESWVIRAATRADLRGRPLVVAVGGNLKHLLRSRVAQLEVNSWFAPPL
jgi:hypothetical protein